MKTYSFPIGKLSITDRQLALARIKKDYEDATSDFSSPYKISVTTYDLYDDGDGDYYLGLLIGKVVANLQ